MLGLDQLVRGICADIFDPLSRSDQRKWAELYVRGLLAVRGRKTMRSIACMVGKRTVEQNLHHFISKSSWHWQPVRRLLAEHVDRMIAPKAWVVEEMVIPKRGPHTVGVERTFVPRLGRVTHNQRAFGVWLAAEQASCPVNWRLMLPSEWATCPTRRRQVDIPESLDAESPDICALNAALEMIDEWDLERHPLIMDARDGDVPRIVTELVERDAGFLLRTGDSVDLTVADTDHLLKRRQPVEWRDGQDSARHVSLAAALPVSMTVAPATDRAPRRTVELTLLAEWSRRGPEPDALWLTNLDAPAASLVRLSKLSRQVAKDFDEGCTNVGIQDFEGRSFTGWHRHVTLASAAHAVLVTAQAVRRGLAPRHGHVLADSSVGCPP